MKGLILAAGKGAHLQDHRSVRPIPTLNIANKAILVRALEHLQEAGIDDVAVVASPETRDAVKTLLQDINPQPQLLLQMEPKGIADAVTTARDFLADDAFVLYLSDNVFEQGIAEIVAAFKPEQGIHGVVALRSVSKPENFGMALLEGQRLKKVLEKPKEAPGQQAITGVYVFDKHIHDVLDWLVPSQRGELEITDAIQSLLNDGRHIIGVPFSGWWCDIARIEDVFDANRELLKGLQARNQGTLTISHAVGKVVVEAGANLYNSMVLGPAYIGAGVKLENAYIGPNTVVGANEEIIDAQVENTLIGEGARILSMQTRITASIIGAGAKLSGKSSGLGNHKFALADYDSVVLQES